MSQAPLVVVLQYPLPERILCPSCWGSTDPTTRTRGSYCDPAHLAKHIKKCHPGGTLAFECSLCRYTGVTRYPQKDVIKHYEKLHSGRPTAPGTAAPRTATTSAASTAASSSGSGARMSAGSSASAPRAGTSGVRSRPLPAGPSPGTREVPRLTRATSRGPTAPSTRPTGSRLKLTRTTATNTRGTSLRPTVALGRRVTTSRTPPSAVPSSAVARISSSSSSSSPEEDARPSRVPSYAAVTAAPATRSSTSPRTSAGAATRGAAILESAATRAAAGVRKVPGGARTGVRAPTNEEGRAPANNTSGARPNESGGALSNTSAADFNTTSGTETSRLSRAADSTSRVAMLRQIYESPPEQGSPPLPPSFQPGSGEGGSRRESERHTPPSAAHTPPSFTGLAMEGAWGAAAARASMGRESMESSVSSLPGIPRRVQPTTCCTSPGSTTQRTTPSPPLYTPVSTSPAALTTATVVTTVVGSPVMSTGLPRAAGGHVTPPLQRTPPTTRSPMVLRSARRVPRGATTSPPNIPKGANRLRRALSALPETPPVKRRTPPPPSPSPPPPPTATTGGARGDPRRRRNDGTSSDEESDSWTVATPRRRRGAPRRAARVMRDSSSEHEGAVPRSAASPPPITATNFPPLGRRTPPTTSEGAARGDTSGRTPPEAHAEERLGERAVADVARHPIAPVNVRGVMGRRGTNASVGGRVGAAGATATRANVARGGTRRPAARRSPVGASGPPGDAPAAAAVVAKRTPRQRAIERECLVALAQSVETLADLDELATRVCGFVEEGGQGGRVRRTGDRPDRSREANRGAGRGRVFGAGDGVGGAQRRPAPAGPRGGFVNNGVGEGGRDRGGDAARIQALFRRNRRKAIREVLSGPAEVCELPTDQVQRYFEEIYSGADGLRGAGAPAEPPAVSGEDESGAALADLLSVREVDRRLRRMNNSAPGPDGHTYRDLRAADPQGRLLTAVFNACLRMEAVPTSWKTSNTVLVYKKGDRERLENWRPLALGDTMPKLFAAVLADRLTDWAIVNEKLSPAQKGFLRDEGCYEHNFVLQEILSDARRSRREAIVAWLDLSNAFGSVPHETIRRALVSAGVPRSLIAIWDSMYDGCTTRVRTADGYTAPIIIRSGVRQGCPLSPIIFDLVIDSVLRAVSDVGPGLELLDSRWSVMAYADDLVLVSRTPGEMRRLLAVAEREAASVGLRFNPAKCATLHIGGGAGGRVLPTPFTIQGQTVRSMADGEAYEHLGIPTGSSVNQTPHDTLRTLTEDLLAVDRSLLAPWQKSEAVAVFLLPRMDFLLRGANVEKRSLKAVDLHVRKLAKSWMNLPQRASAEVVYIPPSRGGCGLLPMADLVDVLSIAHVFRLLTADDRAVKDLAWASLRAVVRRRIGHPPSCDEVASFLSGSLEGNLRGGGEASLWSRARNAARRQASRCVIGWRWLEEREEFVLECRGSRGRTVKIPPGARSQVIGRLRASVAEFYCHTLQVKPDQGKVFEVSSRDRVSNHFLRSGGFTRFADWRFVHRARLDVLPLNGARRWGDGDRRCRRCGAESETLPHVLCHCGPHSAAIQWRHDSVLLRLRRALRLPGNVTVNQRVEGVEGELGELRPDLVVRHEPSKSVVICDVTVPFENRWAAFEEARARKIAKYSPLAEALHRLGYRVVVTAFVVGALGSWDPNNEFVLRQLGIGKAYASMMRRLMVSDSIRWSRDIYVEHVSGMRQYEAPPRREDGGCPDVPIPLAVRRRVTLARADDGALGAS